MGPLPKGLEQSDVGHAVPRSWITPPGLPSDDLESQHWTHPLLPVQGTGSEGEGSGLEPALRYGTLEALRMAI